MTRCTTVLSMLLLLLASCSKDDVNDDIATLTVEMCDMKTDDRGVIMTCVMDDDRQLALMPHISVSWASKPDSVYRALLYYNKVEGSAGVIHPLNVGRVVCLTPRTPADTVVTAYKDPLTLVSSWYAPNGKYLNMCLAVKTGTASDKQAHRLAVVCDSLSQSGHRRYYRVCHSQNGIPTYYSVETYSSITVDDVPKGDTVSLAIPTFDGMIVKDMVK